MQSILCNRIGTVSRRENLLTNNIRQHDEQQNVRLNINECVQSVSSIFGGRQQKDMRPNSKDRLLANIATVNVVTY